MTLDSENQRQLLLQLIAGSQIPGAAVKVVYELTAAIESAEVKPSPSTEAHAELPEKKA